MPISKPKAAKYFKKVIGIEISQDGFNWACANALLNQIKNAEFILGDASSIFDNSLPFNILTAPSAPITAISDVGHAKL